MLPTAPALADVFQILHASGLLVLCWLGTCWMEQCRGWLGSGALPALLFAITGVLALVCLDILS